MSKPVSKTSQAISFFQAGQFRECFRVIDRWRPSRVVSPGELAIFKRAYGCMTNPAFFGQLGFVCEIEVAKAKALFSAKFLKA